MAPQPPSAKHPAPGSPAPLLTLMNFTAANSTGFLPPQHDADSTWIWTVGRTSTVTFTVPHAGVYEFSGQVYLPAPNQTAEVRLDGQYLALANATALSRLHAVRRVGAGSHQLEFRSNLSREVAPGVAGWAWSRQDVSIFIRDYAVQRLEPSSGMQSLGAGLIVLGLVVVLALRLRPWDVEGGQRAQK